LCVKTGCARLPLCPSFWDLTYDRSEISSTLICSTFYLEQCQALFCNKHFSALNKIRTASDGLHTHTRHVSSLLTNCMLICESSSWLCASRCLVAICACSRTGPRGARGGNQLALQQGRPSLHHVAYMEAQLVPTLLEPGHWLFMRRRLPCA